MTKKCLCGCDEIIINKKAKFIFGHHMRLNKGRKLSRHHIESIRNGKKGKKFSEEHKNNLRLSRLKYYKEGGKHGMSGKRHSEETKRKISVKKIGCESPRNGCKVSKEQLSKMSKIATENIIKGKYKKTNNKIEKIIQKLLKEKNINFKTHKIINLPNGRWCAPDILIDDTIIRINGCFWHCCPIHNKESIKYTTVKNVVKKDIMQTEQLKLMKFRIVDLWEHDINENPIKCVNRITEVL